MWKAGIQQMLVVVIIKSSLLSVKKKLWKLIEILHFASSKLKDMSQEAGWSYCPKINQWLSKCFQSLFLGEKQASQCIVNVVNVPSSNHSHGQFKTKTSKGTNSTWDKIIKLYKMKRETTDSPISRTRKKLTNRCLDVVKVLPLSIYCPLSGLLKMAPIW